MSVGIEEEEWEEDGWTRVHVCMCVSTPQYRTTNPIQDDGKGGLLTGQAVSEALVDVVRMLNVRPRFLIAKGGITSNDVATKGKCTGRDKLDRKEQLELSVERLSGCGAPVIPPTTWPRKARGVSVFVLHEDGTTRAQPTGFPS